MGGWLVRAAVGGGVPMSFVPRGTMRPPRPASTVWKCAPLGLPEGEGGEGGAPLLKTDAKDSLFKLTPGRPGEYDEASAL